MRAIGFNRTLPIYDAQVLQDIDLPRPTATGSCKSRRCRSIRSTPRCAAPLASPKPENGWLRVMMRQESWSRPVRPLPADRRRPNRPARPDRGDRRSRTLDVLPLKSRSASLHWEMMFTRSIFQTADMDEQGKLLDKVSRLIDAGTLRTTVSEHFGAINAANLRRAHALIESGKARGKVVLEGFAD